MPPGLYYAPKHILEDFYIQIPEKIFSIFAYTAAPGALPKVAINTKANSRKMRMWPFILIAVLVSAAARLFQCLPKQNPISKIPLVGDEIKDEGTRRMMFAKGAKHVYQEGYRKFKNGLFRVSSPRGMNAYTSHGAGHGGLILKTKQNPLL
jgi:hypothetical protein